MIEEESFDGVFLKVILIPHQKNDVNETYTTFVLLLHVIYFFKVLSFCLNLSVLLLIFLAEFVKQYCAPSFDCECCLLTLGTHYLRRSS